MRSSESTEGTGVPMRTPSCPSPSVFVKTRVQRHEKIRFTVVVLSVSVL